MKLLRNARLVDPVAGIDGRRDLLIDGAKIARVGQDIPAAGHEVTDLGGKVVAPGFFDMHVHLREPGFEEDETIRSGTAAAVAGGFTAVACMPNTKPVNDNQSVTEYIVKQAAHAGSCAVHPIGAITRGSLGEELTEFGDMLESGAVAFSDDGRPVSAGRMMRRALEYSLLFDVPIINHCEDLSLAEDGVMHEGAVSTALGLQGHNRSAEDVMVIRDILLAEQTGAKIHVAHVSTAGAVEMVRQAKARGVRCTAEAAPHHMLLTAESVRGFDTRFKMKPPLRAEEDRAAVLAGLVDGTIDAVATDHAPHHPDKKKVEFSLAPFGVIGLETAVALMLDRVVGQGRMDLSVLVERMAVAPRRILDLPGGTLAAGAAADLVVLDLQRETAIDAETFVSASRNTPFGGWKLKGCPVMTMVAGEVKHSRL